jgi:putative ABC transport system permease protein
MTFLRTAWARIVGKLRGGRLDRQLDEELETHLALLTDEYVSKGLSLGDARAAARRSFGGVTQAKERYRDRRGLPWVDIASRDLRYALRSLWRTPLFTIVAIVTLALGIGANTAFFQLLDAVRLRTLPVKAPDELVEIRIADMEGARGSFETWHPTLTNPIWELLRSNRQPFSGVFAWAAESLNLSSVGEARFVRTLWLSGEGFDVLGISPLRGRLFGASDDRRGCAAGPGVVISYAFWQRAYGGDPSVIGRPLAIAGKPFDVIGVTPARFFGLEVGRTFDIALPLCAEEYIREANSRLDAGTVWWLTVVGRLEPGWTSERASAYLSSASAAIFEASLPPKYPPVSVRRYLGFQLQAVSASSGVSELRESYSLALWMLLGIAGLVLLIACANIANLMLARATAREREVAVRLAIGASRRRVIGQFLTESLVLALMGAAAAVLVARGLSGFLVSSMGREGDPLFVDLPTDVRMLTFTALLAIATCVIFGVAPALQATRARPAEVLRSGGRGQTAGRNRFGLRRALVVSQIALSLVLLVTAILFSGTLRNLLTVDAGFESGGLIVTRVGFRRLQVPSERVLSLRQELVDRLRAIPGVDSATEVGAVPLTGSGRGNNVWVDGARQHEPQNSTISSIGPGYFDTVRTPIVAGRDFTERDDPGSPGVAIVNEAFARALFQGENPVGRRIWIEATPSEPETSYEIVGVARDTKYWSLREPFPPVLYLCRLQDPRPAPAGNILLRSHIPPAILTGSIRRALAEINPSLSFAVQVLSAEIQASLLRERIMAMLSGFFGLLATLLAIVGLYGLISYTVTCRQNEIGIRTALGATRRDVVRMVLRETMGLLIVGLAIGGVLALVAARAAATLLFGLEPHDPATMALAVTILGIAAVAASYIPARRAAGVDPTVALRNL